MDGKINENGTEDAAEDSRTISNQKELEHKDMSPEGQSNHNTEITHGIIGVRISDLVSEKLKPCAQLAFTLEVAFYHAELGDDDFGGATSILASALAAFVEKLNVLSEALLSNGREMMVGVMFNDLVSDERYRIAGLANTLSEAMEDGAYSGAAFILANELDEVFRNLKILSEQVSSLDLQTKVTTQRTHRTWLGISVQDATQWYLPTLDQIAQIKEILINEGIPETGDDSTEEE